MTKIDTVYLDDILNMIRQIDVFISGIDFAFFETDIKTQYAVFHALEVIGEACNKLSNQLLSKYPELPAKEAIELRNFLIHGYDQVDSKIVWKTIQENLPELKAQITQLLITEKNKQQDTYIDKLAYIYLKDKKILVTLSKGKDTWYIPGGKREAGETNQQALVREVKEELTVDLEVDTIKYYGTFEAPAHGKPEGTIVRMTCYMAEYIGTFKPSQEIDKIDFFDYSQKKLTSQVDFLILDNLKQKGLLS